MTKKRKPNRKRLPREFRRPPNDAESMDIAETIYGFAALIADGKPSEAVDAIRAWVGKGAVARLRGDYLASIAPVLTMGLMRKHFPTDMEPDDFWIMDRLPGAEENVHTEALCQVLVRHLNDDHETAQDLLHAHINTHGNEGLFWFGVEAIKALAGVIRSVRDLESGDAA
jgi:hypothetical protein